MNTAPVLSLRRFSYAYPEAGNFTLKEISLDIFPGQCHCMSGPSGSGKTTLLMAVRGLLPQGRRSGELVVDTGRGAESAAPVGIVLQNPLLQLMGIGLGADVAFGLENHCIAPGQMPERVRSALARAGLNRSLATPVANLSMGQQYRACLAGALVMSPAIILLDEPAAQLDPPGLARLIRVIDGLKKERRAVLVCDHRPEILREVIDHYWYLDHSGQLRDGGAERFADPSSGSWTVNGWPSSEVVSLKGGQAPWDECCTTEDKDTAVIRVRRVGLPCHGSGASRVLLSFCLARGERLVISGPNGAGKTTLIKFLIGLERPDCGSVEIFGGTPKPGHLRGQVGVLFQNPGKQLFDTTVFDEVAFAARRRHGEGGTTAERVRTLLAYLGLESVAGRSPHSLSYGQQHMVGLASVLAGEPRVLLLDDPLAGLDSDNVRRVLHLLDHVNRTDGTAILWASHDPAALTGWAHRSIRLDCRSASTEAGASASGRTAFSDRVPDTASLNRLPVGVALIIGILLAMTAFAARSPNWLAVLTGVNLLFLLLGCPQPLVVLRRSAKLFIWQAGMITLLYLLRFGWPSGLIPGLHVAWQLFLAFWPGLIVMAAVPASGMTRALSRVLPDQTAFVMSTCLRFMPMLLSEMRSIRQAQLFRGARLLREDITNPRHWPDWLHCLLVPTLVRALCLASEIAQAASARDFGIHKHRTHWPGDTI